MEYPATVNIAECIDNSKLGRFQLGIVILCGLSLIMDGFDVQSMGYVAPRSFRVGEFRIQCSGRSSVLRWLEY